MSRRPTYATLNRETDTEPTTRMLMLMPVRLKKAIAHLAVDREQPISDVIVCLLEKGLAAKD